VISSTDMPGRYKTGDPGVATSVCYLATPTYKTAFGAAGVVEPAEPVDAVKSTAPGAAKPARCAGCRPPQPSAGVLGASATTPELRDHWLQRDDVRSHIGRRFDIEALRP
jgi:hypothetical protein